MVTVMVLTTCLVTLIMIVIWKTSIWLIALFFVVFGCIEGIYLSSVMYKFTQGGYLPLVFAFFLTTIMGIWHYVHKERYMFELRNKVSGDYVKQIAGNPTINRVPGMGLLYSELVQGIPPIFTHYISHIPSLHSVLVVVSIKSIPVSKVDPEERFLFRQVDPREYRMFRCVVRYGYNDMIGDTDEFERQLVEQLKEFVRQQDLLNIEFEHKTEAEAEADADAEQTVQESINTSVGKQKARRSSTPTIHVEEALAVPSTSRVSNVSSGSFRSMNINASISQVSAGHSFRTVHSKSADSSSRIVEAAPVVPARPGVEEEMRFIEHAMEKGVVYLLGETEVVAARNSSWFKKIVVDYAYSFLRKNFRQGEKVMKIPSTRLLRVGMTYEI